VLWSGGDAPPMQAVVKNFEKAYPNVHVDLQIVPGQNLQTVLSPEVQAGNPPDVAYTCPGTETPYCLGPLEPKSPANPTGSDKLAPLTGPWTKHQVLAVRQGMMQNGTWYGAPLGLAPEVVYYNTKIFSSLGLTPPTRFSQLLSICQKIAASGKTPMAFIAPIDTPNYYLDMAATHFVFAQDPNWTKKREANQVTFANTPGWQRVIQAFVQMKNAKCFSPQAPGETTDQAIASMAQGNSVMLMHSSEAYGTIKAVNPKLTLGAFDFPGDSTAQRAATVGVIWDLDIFKQAHNPTAARAFVNFAMQPAQTELFNRIGGTVSAADLKKGDLPTFLAGIKSDAAYKTMSQPSSSFPTTTWITTVDPSLVGLLSGQITASQQLKTMDQNFSATGS
jgi:raffinose/stachyose/melibiose transport system substrate-binding protein